MITRRNRVYIVPTKLGFLMIAVNFVIFMMGLTYANNMTLLMAFAFFSFLVINMIAANQNLVDIKDPEVKVPASFAPGGNLMLTYNGPRANGLELEIAALKVIPEGNLSDAFYYSGVMGKYLRPRIKLFSTFPSELFYVWRYLDIKYPIFIYPAPIKWDISLLTRQGPSHLNDNGEFEHHIKYGPELPSKRIDWKVYARTRELYWKQNEGDQAQEFNFDINHMPGKSRDEKIGQLSYAIQYAHETGSRYSVKLAEKSIAIGSGSTHYVECLEELSAYANLFN